MSNRLFLAAPALPVLALLAGCGGEVFHLVGTVERKTIEVAAPVSETITEIPVKRGQRVEAGQVLVRLDTEVAEAELEATEAALTAAQATLDAAEREFQRVAGLRDARVASAQEFDRSRRQRDEALAAVAERRARRAQASKRLDDLTVRTHASGVVDQLPFEVGERAAAGGVVAVVVADQAPWVRVWLPARAVGSLGGEATARVEIEGLDDPLEGRLEDVSHEAEFTPHFALTERESAHLVYQARIVLEGAPEALRPGLPARVRLELSPQGSAGG